MYQFLTAKTGKWNPPQVSLTPRSADLFFTEATAGRATFPAVAQSECQLR